MGGLRLSVREPGRLGRGTHQEGGRREGFRYIGSLARRRTGNRDDALPRPSSGVLAGRPRGAPDPRHAECQRGAGAGGEDAGRTPVHGVAAAAAAGGRQDRAGFAGRLPGRLRADEAPAAGGTGHGRGRGGGAEAGPGVADGLGVSGPVGGRRGGQGARRQDRGERAGAAGS